MFWVDCASPRVTEIQREEFSVPNWVVKNGMILGAQGKRSRAQFVSSTSLYFESAKFTPSKITVMDVMNGDFSETLQEKSRLGSLDEKMFSNLCFY